MHHGTNHYLGLCHLNEDLVHEIDYNLLITSIAILAHEVHIRVARCVSRKKTTFCIMLLMYRIAIIVFIMFLRYLIYQSMFFWYGKSHSIIVLTLIQRFSISWYINITEWKLKDLGLVVALITQMLWLLLVMVVRITNITEPIPIKTMLYHLHCYYGN